MVMVGSGLLMAGSAPAAVVSTAVGNGLDGQASEDGVPAVESGNGTDTTANSRFNASSNNEFIVLRFDLSGVDKSTIASAAINMIADRAGSNNEKPQRIWGVNSGVANLNTFAEGASFSSVPGLLGDADTTTQSVVAADTTFLGRFQFDATTDPGEGGTFVLNDALLSGSSEPVQSSLDAFLHSLGTADQAVFLIGGAGASNGQLRIDTKEATSTSTGVLSGAAGSLAPTLSYSVPEPASLSVLALGGLGFLRRRRD
jgi:hypothetical protein